MYVNWRANRQVDNYVVELKLERLSIRNEKTSSQKQDIKKMKTFES